MLAKECANAHEMYMHITPQDGSSSTKKKEKDLAFKASQEKGKARLEYESSSDDEIDDASLALMVRRTAKMLKKLNKSGIKFDGKKKFFTSSRRKPISEMDCYNCGELGHLAHQCTKPKKDKYKKKNKGKKDDSSNEDEDEKKKTSHTRRKMARRRTSTRRKMGRHTSSVIGSRTLIHLFTHPMMIVIMRRWPHL